MELTIKEISDKKEKEAISREILNDLPEWFGMGQPVLSTIMFWQS